MITIGLTGGIASGKSTVSRMLQSAGATVIDADAIARAVVDQGQPAYDQIVRHFGRRVVDADGSLNRSVLAGIIFANSREQQALNRIVHPYVKAAIERRLAEIQSSRSSAVVILDVPLLFEAGMNCGLAEIIVVYVPEPVQLERLIRRDRLSPKEATQRIRSQQPIEQKRAMATIVIDNSGSLEDTRRQTRAVYEKINRKYQGSANPLGDNGP